MKKKIVFITGTRADYGKIKSLLKCLEGQSSFDIYIFVCGMHLYEKYGGTFREVIKDGYKNIYIANDIPESSNTTLNLSFTIKSLTNYVETINPDMIIIHGDRTDALAGAIVGALHNILVGHIEGGELSGTIDESIRHAISKFAHAHFVCTFEAKKRLIQLGEDKNHIFVIGSPDIDLMLKSKLPRISECCKRYDIPFKKYAIFMYHPVTTEVDSLSDKIGAVMDAISKSNRNYIIIYPNNDLGSDMILNEIDKVSNNSHFRVFPSIRFEFFLSFLKNADFIIGNSSAGIREAGIFGVPAIDIGTRQAGRYDVKQLKHIQHVGESVDEILDAIKNVDSHRFSSKAFGKGDSTNRFLKLVTDDSFWKIPIQKKFIDQDF